MQFRRLSCAGLGKRRQRGVSRGWVRSMWDNRRRSDCTKRILLKYRLTQGRRITRKRGFRSHSLLFRRRIFSRRRLVKTSKTRRKNLELVRAQPNKAVTTQDSKRGEKVPDLESDSPRPEKPGKHRKTLFFSSNRSSFSNSKSSKLWLRSSSDSSFNRLKIPRSSPTQPSHNLKTRKISWLISKIWLNLRFRSICPGSRLVGGRHLE